MSQTWTDIKAIYDAVLLKQLTNPNTPGASTINDVTGEFAVTNAKSVFKQETEVSYLETNADHEAAIFELVIYILQKRANKLGDNAKARREEVYGALKTFKHTLGGRTRVTPATSSPLVPNDDTFDNAVSDPVPEFDITRSSPAMPDAPAGPTPSFPFPP